MRQGREVQKKRRDLSAAVPLSNGRQRCIAVTENDTLTYSQHTHTRKNKNTKKRAPHNVPSPPSRSLQLRLLYDFSLASSDGERESSAVMLTHTLCTPFLGSRKIRCIIDRRSRSLTGCGPAGDITLPGTTPLPLLTVDISCDSIEDDSSCTLSCDCRREEDPRRASALRAATAGGGEAAFKIGLSTLLHPPEDSMDSEGAKRPSLRSQMASRGDRTPCCLFRSARVAAAGKCCAAGVEVGSCSGVSEVG